MKKIYATPTAEMINFDYKENVTASGASSGCNHGGGNNSGNNGNNHGGWHWPWWPWFHF